VPVNADEREEITASVAAHAELGPRYEAAVAEGLVERIGEEIDKRVDARLRNLGAGAAPQPAPKQGYASPGQQIVPPGYQGGQLSAPARGAAGSAVPEVPGPAGGHPATRQSNGVTGMILGLGSMGLGVGATAAVVSHHSAPLAQVLMVLLIWAAIAIINIAHAQRR
jgi:hypothetical protein